MQTRTFKKLLTLYLSSKPLGYDGAMETLLPEKTKPHLLSGGRHLACKP